MYHSASNIKGTKITRYEHGIAHQLQAGIIEHISEPMNAWLFKSLTKRALTNWIQYGKKTALAIGIRTMLLIHLNLASPFLIPQD